MANLSAQKGKINAKSVKQFASNNAIIILIALLALFVGLTTQNFFTGSNGRNLLINVAPRFIIACGVSGCLITKGTDLSAGRMVGLSACLSAMLLQDVTYTARMLPWLPDLPVWVALIIVLLIVAFFGAINGCVIAFLKVPPFIATLGMQTIVYGLCSVITNNQPLGGFKQSYSQIAFGSLGPIPYLPIIALLVGIYMWVLFNKTRHGKYMYAIGGNENAAEVAGVNVSAALIRIYILAAVLYGLGGFLRKGRRRFDRNRLRLRAGSNRSLYDRRRFHQRWCRPCFRCSDRCSGI